MEFCLSFPGFRSFQFRGIIRNLYINGERVQLSGKATYGLTEVWHCSAPEVAKFIEELQSVRRRHNPFANRASTPSTTEGPRRRGSWRRRSRNRGDATGSDNTH